MNLIQTRQIFGDQKAVNRQNPNFQTTSTTFETALSATISQAAGERYIFFWQYRANNSKNNTSNATEARVNGGALVTNNTAGQQTGASGNGELYVGFAETVKGLAIIDLTFELVIRRTAGTGNARINTMNIFAFRIE